jgi:hypothetical protein
MTTKTTVLSWNSKQGNSGIAVSYSIENNAAYSLDKNKSPTIKTGGKKTTRYPTCNPELVLIR